MRPNHSLLLLNLNSVVTKVTMYFCNSNVLCLITRVHYLQLYELFLLAFRFYSFIFSTIDADNEGDVIRNVINDVDKENDLV